MIVPALLPTAGLKAVLKNDLEIVKVSPGNPVTAEIDVLQNDCPSVALSLVGVVHDTYSQAWRTMVVDTTKNVLKYELAISSVPGPDVDILDDLYTYVCALI
jgi:hypothetical protein